MAAFATDLRNYATAEEKKYLNKKTVGGDSSRLGLIFEEFFDVPRSLPAAEGSDGHTVRTILVEREVASDGFQIRMPAEVNHALKAEVSET